MVLIKNNKIVEYSIPKTYFSKGGGLTKTIEEMREEGWRKSEKIYHNFDPETQFLKEVITSVTDTKVVIQYVAVDLPEEDEPEEDENSPAKELGFEFIGEIAPEND